jgi:hypothetical protein
MVEHLEYNRKVSFTFQEWTSAEIFDELADEWREVLDLSPHSSPFLSAEWFKLWFAHFGQKTTLSVWTIRDAQQKLLAVVPLYKLGDSYHLLGNLELSDYADFIFDKNRTEEVTAALTEFFSGQLSWQKIELLSVPAASPTLSFLFDQNSKHDWAFTNETQTVCPVIGLPENWDGYLDVIGKKQRHEVKRKWRNLASEHECQIYCFENEKNVSVTTLSVDPTEMLSYEPATELADLPSTFENAFSIFHELHQNSSPEKKAFWTSEIEQFFPALLKEFAKQNWLRLFVLTVDGKHVAASLAFVSHHTFFLYNAGYDLVFQPLSVGQVLTSVTIQYAIQQKLQRYDFLRGDEVYKFRLGGVGEEIKNVLLSRK